MGLGRIAYKLFYEPKGKVRKVFKQGLYNSYIINRENGAMRKAALQLKIPVGHDDNLPTYQVYFLTGKKYWYQTTFCIYSLAKVAKAHIKPVIFDDGSIDEALASQMRSQFPDIMIHRIYEIEERLNNYLPDSKFPYLRRRRGIYPHIRKLTDVHAGNIGWKLLLDSDMLFFQQPKLLFDWLDHSRQPIHMLDCDNSYGYSFGLMEELTGCKIPQKLNVGAIGFKSEEIDWDKVEYWARLLEEREGSHYYQEQAIWAMLMSNYACIAMPRQDYVVLPEHKEVIKPQAILHHYVAESKEWYFKYAWKMIM